MADASERLKAKDLLYKSMSFSVQASSVTIDGTEYAVTDERDQAFLHMLNKIYDKLEGLRVKSNG